MASSPIFASSSASSPGSSPARVRAKPSVQALLDELSDSDSDINTSTRPLTAGISTKIDTVDDEAESSSEDDLPIGGGRLAARLAGDDGVHNASKQQPQPQRELTATTNAGNGESSGEIPPFHENEDEEPAIFKPRRKLLLKRKRVSDDDILRPSPRTIPANSQLQSPLSSPTRSAEISAQPSSLGGQEDGESAEKPRFKALVEKARRNRLAREEAEETKKAARAAQQTQTSPQPRMQRGSSPADDSEEESDRSETAPAKRLAKDARPTRKASRKALEEMKRETQRMNRNMQLAHQARTKKKFTKESFFASFGRGQQAVPELEVAHDETVRPSSSSAPSDAEMATLHSTPPTSPLMEPEHEKLGTAVGPQGSAEGLDAAEDDLSDVPDLMEIISSRRARDSKSTKAVKQLSTAPAATAVASFRASALPVTRHMQPSDSDSDIEVIFEKGSKRKYAAFENLPKRKAKETQSHLALRSLAYIKHGKSKKSTMSAADMGPTLLRAARKQAQEERQAKIEKLKAAGISIQTAEEREQDQEELEDLVEKARMEDEEIRKREKELAKKDGTYVKDAFDEDNSDEEDADFVDEDNNQEGNSGTEEEDNESEVEGENEEADRSSNELLDDVAEESQDGTESEMAEPADLADTAGDAEEDILPLKTPMPSRVSRNARVIDDEDEDDGVALTESPVLPSVSRKTPQSILRSARKVIPGLQHSDDLPLGLTQAFAATMADSQPQHEHATQEQDSMDILRDLPSPQVEIVPRLNRLDSLDMIGESVVGSQTQPLGLNLSLSQSQRVPESPTIARQSQAPFDLTQDAGYSFSPFSGDRFAETPHKEPHSTEETIILPRGEDSPIVQRKGRLQRGRQALQQDEAELEDPAVSKSAFQVMDKAAKRKQQEEFNKKKSEARQAIEEAAEESDDEYAGLGGASDDNSDDEENEDDRQMIDTDTQVGKGDESKLAKLHADRERASDEQAVSKLMKDITTGALRRKRGAADDLDLSDEEDAVSRRREAKRREFAKMRRELLKDEAVGKIAEDKKKQAFLKSIEDHEEEDDEDDFDQPETPLDTESQSQSQQKDTSQKALQSQVSGGDRALRPIADSQLNLGSVNNRRSKPASQRPGTLAEIRESVSFLIDEPDSQGGTIDLGLSDSEDEPEAYINLDRHIAQAEADEDVEDEDDLGDFIVDDQENSKILDDATFKKPELPSRTGDRAPFSERRTKDINVVDRLSLIRQQSSSTTDSNASSKMAFYTGKSATGSLSNTPSLLKRATTNSSLGSMSGRDSVSATGVVTSRPEWGGAAQDKEFVRKGLNTSRNAINYQGRQNLKEEKMSARAGVAKKQQKKKGGKGFLTGLFAGDTWG